MIVKKEKSINWVAAEAFILRSHYSQTQRQSRCQKIHYAQTHGHHPLGACWFYCFWNCTTLKLGYPYVWGHFHFFTFGITLLSNARVRSTFVLSVLLPLGITLLSNLKFQNKQIVVRKKRKIRTLTTVWSSTPTLQQSIRRQQNDYSTESKTRKGLCR